MKVGDWVRHEDGSMGIITKVKGTHYQIHWVFDSDPNPFMRVDTSYESSKYITYIATSDADAPATQPSPLET